MECKIVHRHKERNKEGPSLSGQPARQHENYKYIYLHTKGSLTAGHGSCIFLGRGQLPLSPVQYMETRVIFDRGWSSSLPLAHIPLVNSCNVDNKWEYLKNAKILPGEG